MWRNAMRGFFIVLVVLVAAVIGVGFYQGWFAFSSDTAGSKTNVTVTVDKEKIEQDKEKATEKVQELGQKAKEQTGGKTDKGQE
jgi:cell division protein FtsX